MRNHLDFMFYIELSVRGEQIKRFINMCRRADIRFVNMSYDRNERDCIIVQMSRKDVFRLREYIRCTHVKVKIIRKKYPVYYIFRYRSHYSFMAGIIVMFATLKILGMYIWQVDFYGNYMYTDETLRRYMAENGISNARLLKNIDCDELEEGIRNTFDVTWACVAVKGSRVIVYIKENYQTAFKQTNDGGKEQMELVRNQNADTDYSDTDYSDVTGKCIYSQYEGEVYSIITRSGTPVVKKGEYVSEGQLLVDGRVAIEDDSGTNTGFLVTDADADILIKTTIPYEDSVMRTYEDKLYTDRKRYRLILDNKYGIIKAGIGFGGNTDYDTIIENKELYLLGNIKTGITYGYEMQSEYELVTKERDGEQGSQLLNQRLDSFIKHVEQKGVQITACHVNIEASGNCYRCFGGLEVLIRPETDIRQVKDGAVQ